MATATDRNESVYTMIVREYEKADKAGKDRPSGTELKEKAEKIDPSIAKMAPRSFVGKYVLVAARAVKKGEDKATASTTGKKRGRPKKTASTNGNGNGHTEQTTEDMPTLVATLERFAEQMYETFGGTNRVAFHQFLGEQLPVQAETIRNLVGADTAAAA